MRKNIKLTNQEKGLCELFKRMGYGQRSSVEDIKSFTSENIELIKEVEPTYQTGYPSQASLLFAHYKLYFVNADEEFYPFKIKRKFLDNDFIKQMKRSCRRISKIFYYDKFMVKHSWSSKNYILLIIYVLRKGSKVGIHNLIKPYDKSINYLAAAYLDKKNKKICIHHIPPKIIHYFNLILQEETKTNFVPLTRHKDISWNLFTQNLLNAKNVEVVEIGLNKTDFATGDQIIIRPKDNDAREYLRALLDQKKIINPETFNLSYIDYIKIRRKDGKYNLIKLNYAEDGIIPQILSTNKDAQLIKDLESMGFPIGVKIVDTNIIPKKALIQQLLMSCCISKDELKNKAYLAVIGYMESMGLIKNKIDKNLYLCWKTRKCRGSFFLTRTCPTCGNQRTIKVPNGMKFNFDIEKIKGDLKQKLMQQKVKYRRLKKAFYDNKFELQKSGIKGLPELNVYLNLTGLYEPVLNNFRLCPLPLLVVNFRGEMKNDLKYIHQIDAADFIERLYDSDPNKILEIIKNAAQDTQYGEKKEIAFQNSLKILRDLKRNSTLLTNSKKGHEFEWLTFNILSYFFHISEKWGGKSLPDGIVGFNETDKHFAFWDAKKYDLTKLSNYAKKRKGGIGKDIKYVLKAISQEDTYEEGKLGYYIFVTSNTYKEDFLKVKKILMEKIEKEKDRTDLFKRLNQIKFCCLNLDGLIKLGSVIEDKKDYEILKRKNTEFENAFEKLLESNEGYISLSEIERLIEPLLKEKLFTPEKDLHKIDNERN